MDLSLYCRFKLTTESDSQVTNYSCWLWPLALNEYKRFLSQHRHAGRAGRRDNVRAYCILFTKKKTRGMEKCCELYRKQQDKCRRKLLSEYFNGRLKPLNQNQRYWLSSFALNNTIIKMVNYQKEIPFIKVRILDSRYV